MERVFSVSYNEVQKYIVVSSTAINDILEAGKIINVLYL